MPPLSEHERKPGSFEPGVAGDQIVHFSDHPHGRAPMPANHCSGNGPRTPAYRCSSRASIVMMMQSGNHGFQVTKKPHVVAVRLPPRERPNLQVSQQIRGSPGDTDRKWGEAASVELRPASGAQTQILGLHGSHRRGAEHDAG